MVTRALHECRREVAEADLPLKAGRHKEEEDDRRGLRSGAGSVQLQQVRSLQPITHHRHLAAAPDPKPSPGLPQ
eukprot:7640267-Alexandrium_andersonii.AAC.1